MLLILYAGENSGRLPAYYRIVRTDLLRLDGGLGCAVYGCAGKCGIGYDYLRCPEAGPDVSTTIGKPCEVPNVAPFTEIEGADTQDPHEAQSQVSPSTVLLC